jgi:hypothetical protein
LERGLGKTFRNPDGTTFTIRFMFWADDIYFFAEHPKMLHDMFVIATAEIAKVELTWKPKQLNFIDSAETSTEPVPQAWLDASGYSWGVMSVPRLKVLGVTIDRAGGTPVSVNARIQASLAMWSGCKHAFCNRRLPLIMRIQRWYSTMGRSLLYGAGGWTITVEVIDMLRKTEHRFLREMLCRHPWPEETAEAFNARCNHLVREAQLRAKVMPLALQALQLYYGWAGHVIRMPDLHPLKCMVLWRNLSWFRDAVFTGTMGTSEPRARLARSGRPRRWEDNLEVAIGAEWHELCADRVAWRSAKFRAALRRFAALSSRNFEQVAQWHLPEHISPSATDLVRGLRWNRCWRVALMSDSEDLVGLANGRAQLSNQVHKQALLFIQRSLFILEMNRFIAKWDQLHFYVVHKRRCYNVHADFVCNFVLEYRCSFMNMLVHASAETQDGELLLTSDGGLRSGSAAAGACLWLMGEDRAVLLGVAGCFFNSPGVTVLTAEMHGMALGICLLREFLKGT